MNPIRTTIVLALQLARRRRGVTAGELADAAGCPLRTASRNLFDLAGDDVLERSVPARKGKRLGDWRIVYCMAKVR
jgi:Fic family protein